MSISRQAAPYPPRCGQALLPLQLPRPPAGPAARADRPPSTAAGRRDQGCGPGTARAGRSRTHCPVRHRRYRRPADCPHPHDRRQRLGLRSENRSAAVVLEPGERCGQAPISGVETTSPMVRSGCGEVVTSSRPTPSTRSPAEVSYQWPSTWMAAQIASTGPPTDGTLQAGVRQQVPGGQPLRVVPAPPRVQAGQGNRERDRTG